MKAKCPSTGDGILKCGTDTQRMTIQALKKEKSVVVTYWVKPLPAMSTFHMHAALRSRQLQLQIQILTSDLEIDEEVFEPPVLS